MQTKFSKTYVQPQYLEPIDNFLSNPKISDVFINGFNNLFVYEEGAMKPDPSKFISEKQLRNFAQYWISLGARRLDEGIPCTDVDIDFGVYSLRFHAILDSISQNGTLVFTRIHQQRNLNLEALVQSQTLSQKHKQIFEQALLLGKNKNILISGSTGSGKTTLLNALINDVPENRRVITVEDSNEIKSSHRHCINLQTRQKNIENKGEITAEELIIQSLRMKPDVLVIGEFRGRETQSLLSAFNTGHNGFATIHANSLSEVQQKLETLCLLAGVPLEVAQRYSQNTFDLYVHMQNKGSRYEIVALETH